MEKQKKKWKHGNHGKLKNGKMNILKHEQWKFETWKNGKFWKIGTNGTLKMETWKKRNRNRKNGKTEPNSKKLNN